MSTQYLDIPASVDVQLTLEMQLLSLIPTGTTPSAREMLEKIYLACNLNPKVEAKTFECSPPQAIASSIDARSKELRIAVFGLSPKQIGAQWAAPLYQWMKVGDQYWCFAERLEVIEADIEKKKYLWNCLKVLKQD